MTPEVIHKKLKEIQDELIALDMSLTEEITRHNIDYILLKLCLIEAETALKEALEIVEERNGRMN